MPSHLGNNEDGQDLGIYCAALYDAQEQLDWGTDIEKLRSAAWSLALLLPSHVLLRQIELKVARLVSIKRTTSR